VVAVRVEERGWTEKSLPQMGACNFHRNTLISNPLQRIVVVSWGDIDIPAKTEVYEASGNTPFPISKKDLIENVAEEFSCHIPDEWKGNAPELLNEIHDHVVYHVVDILAQGKTI